MATGGVSLDRLGGPGDNPSFIEDNHRHRVSMPERMGGFDDQLFGDLLVARRGAVDRHPAGLHAEKIQTE